MSQNELFRRVLTYEPRTGDDYDLDSSEPKTPLNRPVPDDSERPHRNRVRVRALRRYETMSSVGDSDSQGSLEGRRAPRRLVPQDSLQSDGSTRLPRLSPSDLPAPRNVTRTPRRERCHPVAKESPLAYNLTANRGSLHPNKAESKHLRSADEGMKVLLGPMPVEEFLDEFLPEVDETEMPDPTGAFDAVPLKTKDEKEIYPKLIEAINNYNRCPGLVFVNTSVTSEQRGRGVSKPDVTVYRQGDMPLLKQVESTTNPGVFHTCANLGLAESFVEVKPDDQDPFFDDHGDDEHFFDWENYKADSAIGKKKKKAFGQAVSYAAEGCARQHRASYLSILVIGTGARLFRWDRAGTIVTRAFDYQQEPGLLCRFLWRFGKADMAERGFDPTVTIASDEESRLFESTVTEEVAFQKGIDPEDTEKLQEALQVHFQRNKVTKALVYSDSRVEPDEYLLSVPVQSPLSTAGRSGRGYWSTKVVRSEGSLCGEVVFLKDVWRIDLSSFTPEGDILSDMADKVPNIPDLDCFGDVLDEYVIYGEEDDTDEGEPVICGSGEEQATRTQEYIQEPWISTSCRVLPDRSKDDLSSRIVRHVHYRMTSKTIGYPLSDFTDAVELFLALQDALQALTEAYKKCKRLHRDVSLHNIILSRSREKKRRVGILIDWEFSVRTDRDGKAGDYYRSGTWAYMSTNALLRRPGFRHSHQDDLEALFYVSVYCGVRWLSHTLYKKLGTWMFRFFDYAALDGEAPSGGDKKRTYKMNPTMLTEDFKFKNSHIAKWFLNAYADLATYAEGKVKSHLDLLTWTSDIVTHHMFVACSALTSGNQEDIEKIEHSVADQFIPEEPYYWATHVSDSRVSEVSQPVSDHGSKRSRVEYEEPSVETGNKRSRVSEAGAGCDRIRSAPASHDASDVDAEERENCVALTPEQYRRALVEEAWRLDEDPSHEPRLSSDGLLVSYSDTT